MLTGVTWLTPAEVVLARELQTLRGTACPLGDHQSHHDGMQSRCIGTLSLQLRVAELNKQSE